MTAYLDKILAFRALHADGRVLVLPNAWDVASACVMADAGAAAIATTSAGVAWSLGAPDGDHLGRDRALDLITRVAAAVDVPVTADIEGGYGSDPDEVADTVRGVIGAGAVGVNIEDADHRGSSPLRPVDEQCERIAAARHAANTEDLPLFINARVDTYLLGVGDPATRLPATLERAAAYLAAGADGIFVPGVTDLDTVAVLAKEVPAPLNVMAGPGAPAVAELAGVGVARVSVGPAIALAAYAVVRHSTRELLSAGTYSALAAALEYRRVDALMPRARR